MNVEFHYFHHGNHFPRQVFFEERNRHLIPGQDDVTDFVFADNLSQAFHDLFGVLLVRVPHTPLVPGLRPSTHLDSMDFLAFHLLRPDDMVEPEDEDTRRVRIRKHRGVPRVLLIETGQMIQMRLVRGIHAVFGNGRR